MTSSQQALDRATQLRISLETAADAFASPTVSALLDSELALDRALAELPSMDDVAQEDRAAVRAELERAAVALRRCRRLGTGLRDFVRLSLDTYGHAAGYGDVEPAFAGRTLDARV